MRTLLLACLLAACDHRPPPPKQDAPPPAPVVDAGSAAAATPDDCLPIGAKIAEVIIAGTTDPQQKAAYEQERTNLVARFSESCTREAWPAAARACFMAAKTSADVQACSRDLAAAQGSGSAQ